MLTSVVTLARGLKKRAAGFDYMIIGMIEMKV
jgi:hypothetical protein